MRYAMKKCSINCFILILISFSHFASSAFGAILYVGPNETYVTIQSAVDDAVNGDTIIVKAGTYTEIVTIYTSVTIQSEEGYSATTVVSSNSSSSPFRIYTDHVTIDGFTCYGSNYYAGIYANSAGNYATIINNCLGYDSSHRNYHGIDVRSSNNTISNNLILYSANTGIRVYNSGGNNTITNNICQFSGYSGLDIYEGNSNIVTGNTLTYNGNAGLDITASNNNIIDGNTCGLNGDGNPEYYGGIYIKTSAGNSITNNTCESNYAAGIALYSSDNNTISGNICNSSEHSVGIYSDENSDNLIITDNTCNYSYNGIACVGNINTITGNTCSSNDNRGISVGPSTRNIIAGNTCNSNGVIGINLNQVSESTVYGNTLLYNGTGISVYYNADNNYVYNNICGDNDYAGIAVYLSEGNKVFKNTCFNNTGGYGIYLSSTLNNSFYLNNIEGNLTDRVVSENDSENTWHTINAIDYIYNGTSYTGNLGNYYSDHDLTDTNNDGITDIVYDLPGIEPDDNHPLVTTSDNYILNLSPIFFIVSPSNGSSISEDDGAIMFTYSADDPEDGDISSSVTWYSDIDGVFTLPAVLSVGTHSITATATDSGVLTATDTITLNITAHVNVAPTVDISAPLDGATFSEDDGALIFSATAQDPEDGDISNSIIWSSSIDGGFTSPAALSVGTHTITAQATDSGGLTGTADIILTINAHVNVAPTVDISAPLDGATFSEDDGALTFSATAQDPEDGDISNSIVWSSSIDGGFTSPAALSVGTHTITAQATDSGGLTGTAGITLTINAHVNVAPTVDISAPLDGATFSEDDGALTFSATAQDPEDGDISNSIIWSSSIDGGFTSPAALSVGTHTITAQATDSGGLTGTAGITLTITAHVNVAPTVDISAPLDGATFSEDDGALTFSAIAQDPEDGDISNSIIWSSSIDGGFTSPAALSVGTHTITAQATDSGGLTGTAGITLTITAHVNVAPAVDISAPLDGATFSEDDGALTFSATAQDPEDGDISDSILWSSNIDGTFTSPVTLSAGSHTITAEVIDSGGLTASDSIVVTIVANDIDYFEISTILSPQFVGEPFNITITAKDPLGNTVTDFNDSVDISGSRNVSSEYIVGTGTTAWSLPMYTRTHDARTQVIYTADELEGQATIEAIALEVTRIPRQIMHNWTIRLKHTNLEDFSSSPAWENDWIVVYQNDEDISTTGWIVFYFQTPFEYNGTDNLMVDFSFNNSSSLRLNGLCSSTAKSQIRTLYYYTSSSYGDPLDWTGTSLPTPRITYNTPNIKILTNTHVAVSPSSIENFTNGIWEGSLVINDSADTVQIQVSDSEGHIGSSDIFDIIYRDTDNDGLPDYIETDPSSCTEFDVSDTDNDGLLDGSEDANQNGILDTGETDPCTADTDGDGLDDGDEYYYGSDPVLADTDNDNISDGDEILTYSTDPNMDDTDTDGINDGDEIAYWGDSWNEDPDNDGLINILDVDSDNDGVEDSSEIYGGSDPADPLSLPALCAGSTLNMVSVYPYTEGFETGFGDWINVSDDMFDWTRNSGSTTSSGTGPSSATEGAYYLYTESSSPNYPDKTAILEGPLFDFSNSSQVWLIFWYHMYGTSMGNLTVEVSVDACNTWENVWNLSGDQGDVWYEAIVDLSAYSGQTVAIRFHGITGSSFTGDMAIDGIQVDVIP